MTQPRRFLEFGRAAIYTGLFAILVFWAGLGQSLAQNCSQFALSGRATAQEIGSGRPLVLLVKLTNKSSRTVTVVRREVPTAWTIYRKSGREWVALSSGGLVRGTVTRNYPEQTSAQPPDLFPNDEYKKLAPGESLERTYDLTEELSEATRDLRTGSSVEIRVVFTYAYEPSVDEAGMGMLACKLETEPVQFRFDLGSNKRSQRQGEGGPPPLEVRSGNQCATLTVLWNEAAGSETHKSKTAGTDASVSITVIASPECRGNDFSGMELARHLRFELEESANGDTRVIVPDTQKDEPALRELAALCTYEMTVPPTSKNSKLTLKVLDESGRKLAALNLRH